jgi:hypothetical protein
MMPAELTVLFGTSSDVEAAQTLQLEAARGPCVHAATIRDLRLGYWNTCWLDLCLLGIGRRSDWFTSLPAEPSRPTWGGERPRGICTPSMFEMHSSD